MSLRFLLLLAGTPLLLTACMAGLQLKTGNTLFHALPGSEFILHVDIVIPPDKLRASFQGGKLLNGASEFEPRCELELRNFSKEPQTIHAGSYIIGKVRGHDRFVRHPDKNIMLAAAEVLQLASDGGDSQWYMNTYHMTFQSDTHKETPVLVCGGAYNYAFYVRYPSLQEMLAALGDYAVLKIR